MEEEKIAFSITFPPQSLPARCAVQGTTSSPDSLDKKVNNLNPITRWHQENPSGRTFYKIIQLQNCQGRENLRHGSRLVETKEP